MCESIYKFPPHLHPQLIPSSAWGQNIRQVTTSAEWKKIREAVFAKWGKVCRYCGRVPKSLDCHEIWEWHIRAEGNFQILADIYPLCKMCHKVCHIGLWSLNGEYKKALDHMAKVRGISSQQAEQEVSAAFVLHDQLSQLQWTMDLGSF